jgi:D-psicose/D-tagatose/L-ribulose 3-epimerase
MKIAVSNIAWPIDADEAIADVLVELGVTGVEVAPTKVWPNPREASDAAIDAYRRRWEARGVSIVAAQALLFGRPDLTLFDDVATRERTFTYLSEIVRVCARLGAKALVFGSPKNRRTGPRNLLDVLPEAAEFFGRLADVAAAHGTCVALEANPPEYGADFVTDAGQAAALVLLVNRPGFRLHLDSACMTMAGDDPAEVIPAAVPLLAHFHVSEPHLAAIGEGGVDHARFAARLAAAGYRGWLSIEMRQPDPFDVNVIRQSVRRVQAVLASVGVPMRANV